MGNEIFSATFECLAIVHFLCKQLTYEFSQDGKREQKVPKNGITKKDAIQKTMFTCECVDLHKQNVLLGYTSDVINTVNYPYGFRLIHDHL